MQRTFHKYPGLRRKKQRGNALVEFAIIAPVLFAMTLVSFDGGMYVYSFISVQSAARVAALQNSGSSESAADQAGACSLVLDQLRGLPGIVAQGTCLAAPLVVSSAYCAGGTACGGAADTPDGAAAALVTVQYTLPSLFRMPLAGPSALSIASRMKLRSKE